MDEQPEIKSLNKSSLKAIYWRPVKNKDGQTVDWMPTLPLPADVQGMAQYLAKGFKLADPRIKQAETAVVNEDKKQITDELMAENKMLKEQLEAAKAKDVAVPVLPTMTPAQERMAKVRAAKANK